MGDWLGVNEFETRLRAVEALPGGLCTVDTCPNTSAGGRSTFFVRINTPSSPLAPRTPVLISGGVHAREWAPPDALVSFIEKLVKTKGTKPAVYPAFVQKTWAGKPLPAPAATPVRYPSFSVPADVPRDILDKIDLYIAPLINPDGRAFSRVPVPKNRWWRKNRSSIGAVGACVDDHGLNQNTGVDINRNFDIVWDIDRVFEAGYATAGVKPHTATAICLGATPSEKGANATYRGGAPVSEAETKNLRWLQEKGIEYFVDVHSFGPTIIYPWGIAEDIQTVDPRRNFLNPTLDGSRDAAYAEYLPPATEARLITIGGRMHDGILQTATLDARAGAEAALDPGDRRFSAEYPVHPSGKGLYPTAGACDDYHFSRQFSVSGPPYDEIATPPERMTYTIECGGTAQGLFWPSFDHEFKKIEREVHAALWSLLAYVAAPFHSPTSAWPITVI